MGFIPSEVVTQVLDRCNIVEVISAYIPLKHAGRNFKAACPFHHEKTPSFVVNPDKQIFHCFGCGEGGNAISFVMKQDQLTFPEAVRMLADKVGIEIPAHEPENKQVVQLREQLKKVNELAVSFFHHNLVSSRSEDVNAAREYLKGRSISLEIVRKFCLGFAFDKWDGLIAFLKKHDVSLSLMEKAGLIIPQNNRDAGFYDRFRNRIIFPIFDVKSKCVAFGARTLEKDNPAKYVNSPETMVYTKGNHLYGLHLAKEAIARRDFVIIVEGYMDFIMPFQAGVNNIVASLGTALTIEQIRLIRRYTKNVVMLFDSDPAGEAAMVRSLDLLIEEGMNVKIAALDKNCDPDSFVRTHGVEKFNERISSAEALFSFKLNYLIKRYGSRAVEDRARICSEILPTIDKFNNAIIKSEYVKQLAQTLMVSQEALLLEMKKVSSGAAGREMRSQTTAKEQVLKKEDVRPVERDLLMLMLDDSEYVPLTKQSVSVADFQSEHVRSIVSKIYELFDGGETDLSKLMGCFDDRNVLRIISSLMASDDLLKGDRSRIHQDCVNKLKQDRLKSRRLELRTQMEVASSSGNQQMLNELMQEFNQLIKG